MLGKCSDGYWPANDFKINEYKVYSNIPSLDDLQEAELIEESDKECNIIMSPLDCERGIISMPYALVDTIHIKLHTPLAHDFSLMGMLNFKDIDTRVNYVETTFVSNDASMSWNADDVITFDGTPGMLVTNTIYVLSSGAFEESDMLPGTSFYIDENMVLHNGNSSTQLTRLSLTAASDVILKTLTSSNDDVTAFSWTSPELKAMNCYTDPNDIYNSDLQIPIIVQACTQWKALGTYYDANQTLDVNAALDSSYQEKITSGSGLFIETSEKKSSPWYMSCALSDTIDTSAGTVSIKEAILAGYRIREVLAESNIKSSTNVYYNKYTETLECIFYGIKVSFSFTDNKYINTIRLNEYNNFEIFIVNDYNEAIENEMYVSVEEKLILFINHNFRTKTCNQNDTIIKPGKTSFEVVSYQYAWHKNPYFIDFEHAFGDSTTLFAQVVKSNSKDMLLSEAESLIEVDCLDVDAITEEVLNKDNYVAWFNVENTSL